MNLFDNIIKNTAELQILSILLDTSDIKKFYYRGIAHIWNCWLTSDQIANQLNISKPTMYKYLKYRKVQLGETIDKQKDQKRNAG